MTRRCVAVLAMVVATWGLGAASTEAAPKSYRNCDAVHQDYKGGIARKGAKDKRRGGGSARYKPHVDTALYTANSNKDRDKDGIACEQ
ncbi:excalibur calcium-binding domain-containing protein [Motilibacter deserti]|uniref:Excalibur calcium-binding domain-containing protein n=1 Tax=Motilibacter deserti TaxID=2714956 RepID=A0ABX0GW85_9ACTN|nr:excalibur calcium-binding domain-containing protein [Motilibacter deserti]NHC14830.1 excalibur calcium-binding domain-containing protein [Motilibacter deserti]